MYVFADGGKWAVLEETAEGQLVVLSQFVVLVEQAFLLRVVLLDGDRLEDLGHDWLGLLLQEDVGQTQKSWQFLEKLVCGSLETGTTEVFLVLLEEQQRGLSHPGGFFVLLEHEVSIAGSQKESKEGTDGARVDSQVLQGQSWYDGQSLLIVTGVDLNGGTNKQGKVSKCLLASEGLAWLWRNELYELV